MTTKLNCSVCGYTEIKSNNCPNCSTDLSLLRMLQQLPQIISCPGEDLWLTQKAQGTNEVEIQGNKDVETQRNFYSLQLRHESKAEAIIGEYSSTIKDYFSQDLLGAVCNRFARKLYELVKIAAWLVITLFILTVGIGLGVVGCFFYSHPPATSAQVVLRKSHNDDGWKPSQFHWLLKNASHLNGSQCCLRSLPSASCGFEKTRLASAGVNALAN
ncbi:MAG: hypothetical protein PUP92_08080 [Rhizonema sp. PD38]|nr:hypothetical protein [Rhizonema sp. PD38]